MARAVCSIEGCERPVVGRGWCNLHWRRWSTHGDPLGGGPSHIGRAVDHPDGTRTCTKCGERKLLDQFDKVKNATLGRRSNCKACRSQDMKTRYRLKEEELRAAARQRRRDNPDATREADRRRNREPHRVALHAERMVQRRARMAGARTEPGVTRENLRRQYGDACFYCGVEMDFTRRRRSDPLSPTLATVEHVHPIALGGSHTWDNVVLACWKCNCSKRHTPLAEWTGPPLMAS